MAKTQCTNPNCKYEAITWHKDLKNPEPCRKCGGKLEVLACYKEVK